MEKINDIEKLSKISKNIRIGIIEAVFGGNSGHPGG